MTAARRTTALLAGLRTSSLGAKLALLGALLTACVVGSTFFALRITTERNIRRVFATELQESQRSIRQAQNRDRQLLLRSAILLSSSPTLRAALDWRTDVGNARLRAQQTATVENEANSAFAGLGDDVLLITDDSGRVVTTVGNLRGPPAGTSLRSLPAVYAALFGQSGSPDSAFGVLDRRGAPPVEIAAVPILVHGFPVGALVLGRRVDRIVRIAPASSFLGTHAVVASDRVLASSLEGAPAGSAWHPQTLSLPRGASALAIAGEDYVTAIVPLGLGQEGRPVNLYLLRSLNAAIGPVERALTWQFLLAGILAVVLVGAGAAALSRTTLLPLSRFVNFMQSGTAIDRYARFNEPNAPREIATLTDTYNQLIESLQHGHEELQLRTVDLAQANDRLTGQINRRERAEQALRESEEQLRQAQKLEALGALAGGVAHDFNNILSIILGYAEIVQSELPAGSSPRADVGKISDAAVRARTLVRQLLAFSRKQILQPQVLDLNQVVAGVEPLLRPLIGEDVLLEVKLAPDLARVTADPGQIEQVILNLAVNARDAMPSGGRLCIETANVMLEPRVEEYPVAGGPVVMLAVSDTGIGMDVATRRRIFEPFFTTKPVGKGTGLGLATVYGIIRQSEGNITVFSEPGAGSVFRCYFPRAATPDGVAQFTAITPAPSRGAETILIAEDEAELRALMRRALERQGYHVLQAGDGAEALDVAANHDGPIHLVVTDVVMPRLSGKELAVRLLERRPGIRVLFISGYSDEAIERHGVLTPDSVYLEKPVSPEALSRTVRELLDAQLAVQAT
jgi:signal transduction histidine kinase/ActR/RegA family two-component response regulator